MKAVIMAGGEGRRLRPVSGELPKPLVPFLGRSIMEHIILLLRENGFDEICVTLGYKGEMIRDAFKDGSALGVKLCYRSESEPVGTAGGVKNCEDFYGNEDFLVISGDAACDFRLSELMRQHKAHHAAATLALYRHSSPLSYGLAVTDGEDNIRAFIEKPDWPRVVTDRVNTGIYVISPEVMRLVPTGRACDFGKELFPEMLRRGMKLVGIPMDGYWCDIGTPLSYYSCCCDALRGLLKLSIPDVFYADDARHSVGDEDGCIEEYPCRDRAALMAKLSEALLEMNPDLSRGLTLDTPRGSLRIAPAASRCALRIFADSSDAEFAKEFALSAKELIRALDRT